MPRVKMSAEKYALDDLIKNVRKCALDIDAHSVRKISQVTGIEYKLLQKRFQEPETIKLPELVKMITCLGMSAEDLEPLFRKGAVR